MVRFVVSFYLAALCLSASAITSSVSCMAGAIGGGAPTVATGEFSCSIDIRNPQGYVMTRSSATVSSLGALSVSAGLVASAEFSFMASTSASITATDSILTSGSVRPGYAELVFAGGGMCLDCGVFSSASFDRYYTTWGGHYGECMGLGCMGTVTVPITLGEMVLASVTASSQGIGWANGNFQSFGGATAALSFALFESDGLTPVAWTETTGASVAAVPEPSVFWLIAAVLIYCIQSAGRSHPSLRRRGMSRGTSR